ncbi:MAG: DUF6516 family protein [Candidatus Njordarchaeum guaymaensis]
MYRYDNTKHWKKISTYPHHFHNGSEENIQDSHLPRDPLNGVIFFLRFIRMRIKDRNIVKN